MVYQIEWILTIRLHFGKDFATVTDLSLETQPESIGERVYLHKQMLGAWNQDVIVITYWSVNLKISLFVFFKQPVLRVLLSYACNKSIFFGEAVCNHYIIGLTGL